ncbi:Uncharacterised protein [Vibrio cholerae]|uniref:Uncharacterized protein n=1 Tax=Vibrio cholerae TaxID=666 RepID=A0A655XT64_VIBCL|nr:Uncharacterised protein [Vibrio cholerae]CSB36507.1 Uncharacterised protein [Vibrio cholerae]CSB39918.1 Uncharacterised protein [Vibrio cholerae]CSB85277.1 Uncharacterised protein [Vibrio cholerae]CSC01552.1 Uncharacterised protein [Vibrio cholerae]
MGNLRQLLMFTLQISHLLFIAVMCHVVAVQNVLFRVMHFL